MYYIQRWLYARQCEMEGGFNGRTNKLVDGCYSWYVGSSIKIVSQLRGVGAFKTILRINWNHVCIRNDLLVNLCSIMES